MKRGLPSLGDRAAWILLLGTLCAVLAPVLFEGEVIASHDGRPEKLEATRSLEAFLAMTLSVDADRFDQ